MGNIGVKLLLFATLRDECGVRELEVQCDGTVRNLIENANKILGRGFWDKVYDTENNKVKDNLIFTINGRNIKDITGEARIEDGDKVAIFPPLAGG